MNVCFIGKHKYPKDIYSNEQDLKTWRSLAEYFDKLFVVVESPDLLFHFGKENNIRIYLVPRLGYAVFIKCAVILGLYLKLRFGIDVFDASEVVGGGTAATFLKFLTGAPSVIEIQGEVFRGLRQNNSNLQIYPNSTNNFKSLLLQKIGRFAMKKANRIRVISHAIFNQVKKQGIEENKIRLVSLRVDLESFVPGLGVSETYKSGDKVGMTLGYIGRLVEGKGLEDLLEAVKILKSQNLGFRTWNLVIYGTGPLGVRLKEMAEDLKIDDKIDWRGFVPYSKVPEALAQIDIFVYPSWHEGFGRSIMEALAMEKAVVATCVGGIPDLIKDEENGFLVPPHDPKALAEKIHKFMEDRDLREKFGKAGRKWVSENFEWEDGIKKFASLFLEIK
ncbi:MAG: glycosyltransferase family 4 protein [Candidatus Omnitrophota bacterium]|nr:glycosyltransferase family 4 protein [Candidatus Omnitrophota bacterium]